MNGKEIYSGEEIIVGEDDEYGIVNDDVINREGVYSRDEISVVSYNTAIESINDDNCAVCVNGGDNDEFFEIEAVDGLS